MNNFFKSIKIQSQMPHPKKRRKRKSLKERQKFHFNGGD
jgi:hypothetical protein